MQNPDSKKITLIIFASGNGSNAVKIIDYAQTHNCFTVKRVFSNNKNAPVLQKAREKEIDVIAFTKEEFYHSDKIKDQLNQIAPDLIVLAGFMWIFPKFILDQFPGKVINIHPALLPKYGGKGMYGDHVHKAVLANREKQSGITIHYVNEKYDKGQIIAQYLTQVDQKETPESLKNKIKELEHHHYPRVIHQLVYQQNG